MTSFFKEDTLQYMDTFLKNVIEIALKKAKQAAKTGEIPVCAVIFESLEKKIISTAVNRTERDHDPTAHAEILAIKKACRSLNQVRLNEYDLYVTLEPCPMCATAISFARLRRLYFGAYDIKGGAVDHGCRIYYHTSNLYVPEIYGGIAQTRCAELLTDFFKTLRGETK